ncbi:calcium/sodium antiporter [uncultured Cocleimonas sp.]|uniref:calcium/sodium antiporter n=1 Tax=uncultured Cocleimonas sp. TaxID=1051587 RepID=UPI0026300990|nr:calcium/sodium antiporter [uncultured Cocleimonas sp.]
MLTFVAAIIFGLFLLIWSADRFIDGASNIARTMGISPLIVGMLIIGLGTSAPEMLVSAAAALQGNPGLGIGNAIGSNITNITLVLGVTAMFFVLPVHSRLLKKEIPLVLASAILAWLLMLDNYFSRMDSVILVCAMAGILYWMISSARRDRHTHDPLIDETLGELPEAMPFKQAIIWTIVGLLLLLVSSKLLVWGASSIASIMGITDLVIGLTIVAIGTSLPELAATISSARKGETDLAVGNIVGSNLFNTLAVLPIPALIQPLEIPEGVLDRDIWVMLGLTVVLLLFSYGCFKNARYKITKLNGLVLFLAFIAYEALLYFKTIQ